MGIARFSSVLALLSAAFLVRIGQAEWIDGKHPFHVEDNWKVCWRNMVNLSEPILGIDYGSLFNKTLSKLARIGGGALVLKEGVYNITAPVEVPSNTCIIGAGMGATTIFVTGWTLPWYPFKGVLFTRKGERVSLINFSLDGNTKEQYRGHPFYHFGRVGIYQERTNHSWLINVESYNHYTHGFDLHGSDGIHVSHVVVDGCKAFNNSKDGLRLDQSSYVGITNGSFSNNGRHGIAADASADNIHIWNTQLLEAGSNHSYGCGLWLNGLRDEDKYKISNIEVSASVIRNSLTSGMCLTDVKNVLVNDTSIREEDHEKATCYEVRNVVNMTLFDSTCYAKSGVTFASNPIAKRTKAAIPTGSSHGCRGSIAFFDVCCPLECGYCGAPGCSDRGGDAGKNDGCCYKVTKEERDGCHDTEAPCVLRNAPALNF